MVNTILADVDRLQECTPCKFVGGKYKGKSGWIDKTRKRKSETTIPIIIKLPDDGGLYQTNVAFCNVRELSNDKPMTYAEAVFLVPDIEAGIVEVCRKIAKFDISKEQSGIEGFKEMFGKELETAQEQQGKKEIRLYGAAFLSGKIAMFIMLSSRSSSSFNI